MVRGAKAALKNRPHTPVPTAQETLAVTDPAQLLPLVVLKDHHPRKANLYAYDSASREPV